MKISPDDSNSIQPKRQRAILAGLTPGGGGVCVFHPLSNSFVFTVKRLKFCTELLWDKMNIFLQKKLASNQ